MYNVQFLNELRVAKGEEAIVGLCTRIDGEYKLIGTGFFINDHGMFITAKHVLEGEPGPIDCFYFPEEGTSIRRQLVRASLSTESDFAIGILQQAKHKKTGELQKNKIFSLSTYVPRDDEPISTYAYPETVVEEKDGNIKVDFKPKWYHGKVSELFPKGMGFVKSPALIADMESIGGCSGGPVFSQNSGGGVIGINSRGIEGQYNVVSLSEALLSVVFHDITVKDRYYEHISIKELIDLGFVTTV